MAEDQSGTFAYGVFPYLATPRRTEPSSWLSKTNPYQSRPRRTAPTYHFLPKFSVTAGSIKDYLLCCLLGIYLLGGRYTVHANRVSAGQTPFFTVIPLIGYGNPDTVNLTVPTHYRITLDSRAKLRSVTVYHYCVYRVSTGTH